MAALPEMGVDPQTGQPMEMPQDGMPPQDHGVDPNSPPADPNLDVHAGEDGYDESEAPTRERVELCLLLAIETCAKGVEVGQGATNAQMAVQFAQSAASLAQAYQSLTGAESKERETDVKAAGVVASAFQSAGGNMPPGNEQ